MLKKILTMSTVASSILVAHPSQAMFCCCGDKDDEETRSLHQPTATHTNIQGQAQYFTIETTAHINREEPVPVITTNIQSGALQQQERLVSQQNPTYETQIISNGNIQIVLPKNLTIQTNLDGSTSLALRNVFNIEVFPNYDTALTNNKDVEKTHQVKLTLETKESLEHKMNLFYKDVRGKVQEDDKTAAENVINCIQVIVNQYPDDGPYPVKVRQDPNTKSCMVLFKIEDSALLVKGPARPEKK